MRYTLFTAIIIAAFGCLSTVMLASVASSEVPGQLIYIGVGLLGYFAIQLLSPQFLRRYPFIWFGATLAGLILTLFLGKVSKGAIRWLPIGPVHIQLSELAKPVLALTVAAWCSMKGRQKRYEIIGPALLGGLMVGLVFLQPDLGSAMCLAIISIAAVYFSASSLRSLLPWVGAMLVLGLIVWQFFLYGYQKQRIYSFISPKEHTASSYNAEQALIAVGSGKLEGRGIGHGVQSNLKFLPEFHTDFFFAALAEELGFVGVGVVLLLYGALFLLLSKGFHATSPVVRFYSYAYFAGLFFQTIVHIGMNTGLFPVTGIPLPLLSSGGSSFVSTALGLGIAMRFQQGERLPLE